MADPPFSVAERSLPSASFPSLIQYYLMFLIVFGIEKKFDGIRNLHIGPHNSGYGCDISMHPNLLHHMIWDIVSPSIATIHAILHRITAKHRANTTSTKNDPLVAAYVFL